MSLGPAVDVNSYYKPFCTLTAEGPLHKVLKCSVIGLEDYHFPQEHGTQWYESTDPTRDVFPCYVQIMLLKRRFQDKLIIDGTKVRWTRPLYCIYVSLCKGWG